MSKPKLIYFDAPVSRGEEVRLALHIAGVDFHDERIKFDQWPAMKPTTPYGSLPVLEMPGKPALAQTNAILVMIGRAHGLHPKDDFVAAQHEAMMNHVEDLRANLGPTMRMADAEKKAVREKLASSYMPAWAEFAEKNIPDAGPFFGGAKLNVVDLKLNLTVRWFIGGKVDHIPATIFSAYPKLNRIHDAVRDHAGVKSWYAKG